MELTSPYLAAAPTSRVRPLADHTLHCLKSLERDLVVIPVSFVVDSGVLQSQQASPCFVVDQTSGVMRIYHPVAPADGIHAVLYSEADDTCAVDRSTAASGYIEVDIGSATGTYSGFIAIRGNTVGSTTGTWENAAVAAPSEANLLRKLAGRMRYEVTSPVNDLGVSAICFSVDGSGDPVSTTFGGDQAFFVEHTDDGEYEVSLITKLAPETVLLASVDGLNATATVSGNVVTIATYAAGVQGDPASGAEVQLLILAPASRHGASVMSRTLTAAPASREAKRNVFPASGLWQEAVLVPFSVALDGSGDAEAAVLPQNITVTADSGTLWVEFGQTAGSCVIASAIRADDGTGLACDYSEVDTNGRVAFDLGDAISCEVIGYIIATHIHVR